MPAFGRASKRGRANRGAFWVPCSPPIEEQAIYIMQTICQQKSPFFTKNRAKIDTFFFFVCIFDINPDLPLRKL